LGNVNIVRVAERAGVSISTVSRVLNDTSYPVKPATRQKVEQAIEELGYRPNHLARGLLLKKTSTIGLVIPDIANPYYPGLSRGVEDVASEHQYNIIFCNTDRDTEKSKHYINALIEKRVDGIIIAGGGTDFSEEVSTFSQFNTKIILIGRHNLAFPSVQVDNVRAAHDATSHLAELGHRHIAFISGPSMLTSVQDRLAGYRRSLAEHTIAEDDRLIYEGKFTEESGYAAVQSLFADAVKPTAIFATNDRLALGAMAAAIDLGLRVPQDLALVGFDNIIMASYVRPALTTVAIPTYEIGATAMQLMLTSLAGETVPNTVHISTRLIVRESSGSKT
jgi:DNA-binding LacI/PurR family transcriptional regulator